MADQPRNPEPPSPLIGRPPLELKTDEIERQIYNLSGNLTAVAKLFGVHRHTIMARVQKNKKLKAVLDDAREQMKDNVESALYSKALNGDTPAMIFFLKTQAKDRGYIEKQEIGIDGIPNFEELAPVFRKVYGGEGSEDRSDD